MNWLDSQLLREESKSLVNSCFRLQSHLKSLSVLEIHLLNFREGCKKIRKGLVFLTRKLQNPAGIFRGGTIKWTPYTSKLHYWWMFCSNLLLLWVEAQALYCCATQRPRYKCNAAMNVKNSKMFQLGMFGGRIFQQGGAWKKTPQGGVKKCVNWLIQKFCKVWEVQRAQVPPINMGMPDARIYGHLRKTARIMPVFLWFWPYFCDLLHVLPVSELFWPVNVDLCAFVIKMLLLRNFFQQNVAFT